MMKKKIPDEATVSKMERKLFEELQQLDDHIEVPVPDAGQLLLIFQEQRRVLRRKWLRELILFLLTAVLILITPAAFLYRSPVVYMIFQTILFIALLICFLLPLGGKNKMEGRENE